MALLLFLKLDVVLLDDFLRDRQLLGKGDAEFLNAAAHGGAAGLVQRINHVRCFDGLHPFGVQLVDDGLWRFGWGELGDRKRVARLSSGGAR